MDDERELTNAEKEDFWLEIGPPSAYTGLECYDTAVKNGDASPDAARLGWPGAEPGEDLAVLPGEEPELPPDDFAPDDVPPIDL